MKYMLLYNVGYTCWLLLNAVAAEASPDEKKMF